MLKTGAVPGAKGRARGGPPLNNTYILYHNHTPISRGIGAVLANFMSCARYKTHLISPLRMREKRGVRANNLYTVFDVREPVRRFPHWGEQPLISYRGKTFV